MKPNYIHEALKELEDIAKNKKPLVEECKGEECKEEKCEESHEEECKDKECEECEDGKCLTEEEEEIEAPAESEEDKLAKFGIEIEDGIAVVPSTFNYAWKEHNAIPGGLFKDMGLKEIHLEDSPVDTILPMAFEGNPDVIIFVKPDAKLSVSPRDLEFLKAHVKEI